MTAGGGDLEGAFGDVLAAGDVTGQWRLERAGPVLANDRLIFGSSTAMPSPGVSGTAIAPSANRIGSAIRSSV